LAPSSLSIAFAVPAEELDADADSAMRRGKRVKHADAAGGNRELVAGGREKGCLCHD